VSLHRLAVALLLLVPLSTLGAGAFTSIHPEEAYPDPAQGGSSDPYTGFITSVQEKLRELGFDAGPANGDFGPKTQTALGQFQLSRDIPASGQLDDATLAELGVQREAAQASAGASADSPAGNEQKPDHEPEAKPEAKPGA
jgi:peptidoglycan hydrolase-like protein with peptidoglycan-binding domain